MKDSKNFEYSELQYILKESQMLYDKNPQVKQPHRLNSDLDWQYTINEIFKHNNISA